MSVRKDASGRRSVEAEVEVPGTPEEVWQAIATGPGVSSWFVPTEERDDGTIVSHFGPGMDVVATRTAYDPPHRFAGEAEFGPGGPTMATEWIVEARASGTCVVRVVHSLFAETDEWDSHLDGIESGWPAFFRILGLYLMYFRGEPCASMQVMGTAEGPASSVWSRVAEALGVAGAVKGERRRAGVVEQTGEGGHPHQVLLRVDEPAPGLIHAFTHPMGGQVLVMMRFYFYGPGAPAAALEEARWQSWLSDVLR